MIEKNCTTCEYCFSDGICAGNGEIKYGEEIDDFQIERSCWSISFDYSIELAGQLEEHERVEFENSFVLGLEHLLYRIENGVWKHKSKYGEFLFIIKTEEQKGEDYKIGDKSNWIVVGDA